MFPEGFYEEDDAEQYPQAYGIPRWWPWPRFPEDPAFKCRNGCGAVNVKVNSLCLDCEVKANLPAMELALEEIRGER